jgi:hypothetical protein
VVGACRDDGRIATRRASSPRARTGRAAESAGVGALAGRGRTVARRIANPTARSGVTAAVTGASTEAAGAAPPGAA